MCEPRPCLSVQSDPPRRFPDRDPRDALTLWGLLILADAALWVGVLGWMLARWPG
jgi:hypothetical protein